MAGQAVPTTTGTTATLGYLQKQCWEKRDLHALCSLKSQHTQSSGLQRELHWGSAALKRAGAAQARGFLLPGALCGWAEPRELSRATPSPSVVQQRVAFLLVPNCILRLHKKTDLSIPSNL